MSKKNIFIEDNGNKEFETVSSLIEELEYWKKWAEDNDKLEEFMNLKISTGLYDIKSQIVEGSVCTNVGWCGDRFVLIGNIEQLVAEVDG
jgi:hypothetical protein